MDRVNSERKSPVARCLPFAIRARVGRQILRHLIAGGAVDTTLEAGDLGPGPEAHLV